LFSSQIFAPRKFEPMVGIEPTTYSFAYTSISPEKFIRGLDCILLRTKVGAPCQSFEPTLHRLRSYPSVNLGL